MNETAQDYAEYAILLGFIAVLVIVGVTVLGESILGYFDTLVQAIPSWGM